MAENQNYTEYVVEYLLHDPIGNMEAAIAEFDVAKLSAAEQQGAVFIAVYNTGRRELVHAADIEEPQPRASGVILAKRDEVLEIAKATCAVFDALEKGFSPATDTAAATVALSSAENETKQTFEEALAVLKALVYGEAEDADA